MTTLAIAQPEIRRPNQLALILGYLRRHHERFVLIADRSGLSVHSQYTDARTRGYWGLT